jgi:hypothetical protein
MIFSRFNGEALMERFRAPMMRHPWPPVTLVLNQRRNPRSGECCNCLGRAEYVKSRAVAFARGLRPWQKAGVNFINFLHRGMEKIRNN